MFEVFKYMIEREPQMLIRMLFELTVVVTIILGIVYEKELIKLENRAFGKICRKIRIKIINSKRFMAWLDNEKPEKVNVKPNLKWSKTYEQFKKN